MKTLSTKLELTISAYRGTGEDDDDRAETAKGKQADQAEKTTKGKPDNGSTKNTREEGNKRSRVTK